MTKDEALQEIVRLMKKYNITIQAIQSVNWFAHSKFTYENTDIRQCRCYPPCKVGYCNNPQL